MFATTGVLCGFLGGVGILGVGIEAASLGAIVTLIPALILELSSR